MQYKNLNIPVQKSISAQNIYFSTKIFVSVPKIFISVQKNVSFPKSINISQVSLRPTSRREVSHLNVDIQREATTYYFKKLQI